MSLDDLLDDLSALRRTYGGSIPVKACDNDATSIVFETEVATPFSIEVESCCVRTTSSGHRHVELSA